MQPEKFRIYLQFGLILLLLGGHLEVAAQDSRDTLITKYGDVLIGKINNINTENIKFKVRYRNDAIEIKFSEIARISSNTRFLLYDLSNNNWRGTLVVDTLKAAMVGIQTEDSVLFFKPRNIFSIAEDKKKSFNDLVKLGLDFGINRIKADNSLSANLGVNAAFTNRRWRVMADYSAFSQSKDTILNYWRNGLFSGSFILSNDWFLTSKLNLYASTEQSLKLRRNIFFGMGKIFVHRSDEHLSMSAGAMTNREEFSTSEIIFSGTESFISSHYIGKIKGKWEAGLDASLFPSLSQIGRIRSNINTDIKYKFLNHFHLGLQYKLYTDNQPPVEASQADYVFSIRFGWSSHKF